MQKAIAKYGLAAHLALLAVAPLFLFPFCGADWTVRALLWLSLSAFVWMLSAPSCRKDELPHDARARVALSVRTDPLFWFSLFLVVLAAVRWANDGVAMCYDAEAGAWILSEPRLPFLPGCAAGSGAMQFAVAVAAVVLMQAARHALGKSARVCFLFAAAFLAGVAALTAGVAVMCGHARTLDLVTCPTTDAAYVGSAFGLHLMGSMVATAGAFERKWQRAMPLLAIGIAGCAVGLYLFAPDLTIAVYVVGAVLALAMSLVYAHVRIGSLAAPKILAFLLAVSALPAFFIVAAVPDSVKEARFAALFADGRFFADGFLEARAALSAIAAKVWKEHPWFGTGLGSFALDIRFTATPDDWNLFSARQVGALNGWWQMLAERGISGILLFVAPVFFLAWTYVLRAVAFVTDAVARHRVSGVVAIHPVCVLGPLAVAAAAACGFFDHSFWSPETVLAAVAMFAMAGSAFPVVRRKSDGESETES